MSKTGSYNYHTFKGEPIYYVASLCACFIEWKKMNIALQSRNRFCWHLFLCSFFPLALRERETSSLVIQSQSYKNILP